MTSKALPKRLIEVDLPIKRISVHSRREKGIRRGHISTLHIWWARRPLAACRAVICAALWPDPADPLCPAAFRNAALATMLGWTSHERQILLSEESRPRFEAARKDPKRFYDSLELRGALLDFIADFANWDNSTVREYLETSRALTQAAHEALGGAPGTRPLVVDPFAGGGSIPLEALRVGADAFASDLNPIPVLLNKIAIEYIPKYGQRLADEVRKWGEWIEREAERELAEFYPKDDDGGTPIAYFWARTIQCEGPGCGADVPMLRSLWLAKKPKRKIALKLIANREKRRVEFEILEKVTESEVGRGTSKRSSVTCPLCGYTTPRINVEAQANRNRPKERLIAVVFSKQGTRGKIYRLPTEKDELAIKAAGQKLDARVKSHTGKLTLIPNEELPYLRSIFNVHVYGYRDWGSLFSERQKLAVTTMLDCVEQVRQQLITDCEDAEFAAAVTTLLAFGADRIIANCNTLSWWVISWEVASSAFARQALGMVWDFTEIYPFAEEEGWSKVCEWLSESLEAFGRIPLESGTAVQSSADKVPLPDDSAQLGFTDPPYYDAVPYADLSDFFYVWLRRSIGPLHPQLFDSELSPKESEIVELAGRNQRYAHKTKSYFEQRMSKAFEALRVVVGPGGIIVIVFAHTATESWEALLQAALNAGLVVTGSWPIDTEKTNRPRAQSSATLSSSVHIVCRPRENPDGSVRTDEIGDWRDVLQELPSRIHEWMPRLAEEGVVGADAIFACLGPALEIFSRYSRVEKASGEAVTLKDYLEHVWAAVAKEALAQVFKDADTASFEPDARLTAMWLWTLNAGAAGDFGEEGDEEEPEEDEEARVKGGKAKGGFVLEYDAARKIAQGLGANLENLNHVVEVFGETARLIPVSERTEYLFGKEQGQAPISGRKKAKAAQMKLFEELAEAGDSEAVWGEKTVQRVGETTLDRVHQAMILFATGRGAAMKRFLVDDGAGNDQRFWSLAQALSALYPQSTTEKRWVDGVLARKKGLGL